MLIQLGHLQELSVELTELTPQNVDRRVRQFHRLPSQIVARTDERRPKEFLLHPMFIGAAHRPFWSPDDLAAHEQSIAPFRQRFDQPEIDQSCAKSLSLQLLKLVMTSNLTVCPSIEQQIEVAEQGLVFGKRRFLGQAQSGR